ncbi:hypothetical protein [Spirosoma spitsbergense]|uniref:hypothetical protein n=1 Tax=Spirosoma spitsbergense TaxID=431554 RepID=UPI000379CEAA|nr:hypothetical protein [Spirosoma spitsbergense]
MSQFATGYSESFGLGYELTGDFNLQLGLLTIQQTIVTDPTLQGYVPQNYGVPLDQTSQTEITFQLVANYAHAIASNINLNFRYQLFADYQDLVATDHRLDLIITGKINN